MGMTPLHWTTGRANGTTPNQRNLPASPTPSERPHTTTTKKRRLASLFRTTNRQRFPAPPHGKSASRGDLSTLCGTVQEILEQGRSSEAVATAAWKKAEEEAGAPSNPCTSGSRKSRMGREDAERALQQLWKRV